MRGRALVTFGLCAALLAGQATAQATADDRTRLLRDRDRAALEAAAAQEQAGLPIEPGQSFQPVTEPCFVFTDIDVEGVESLMVDTVSGLVAPFVNSCMGATAIDAILQAITQAYLDKGLITSRAYLPEQDPASGRLLIVVVEGVIEDVAFAKIEDGQAAPGPKRRFASAFPTEPGKILNLRDLEQGIDQMNRVPSAQAQLDIAPGATVGGSILQVAYADEDRTRGRFTFGHATRATGYEQTASLLFEHDNLLGINDTFFLGLSGAQTSNTLSTSFSFPVGYLTVTADANYSESVTQLTPTTELFEPETEASLTASWLIARDDRVKSYVEASLGWSFNERFINATALTPQDFRTISIGYRREIFDGPQYFTWSATITTGEVTSDTSGIVPGVGPQAHFKTLDFSAAFQQGFDSGDSLFMTWSGQAADGPLFSQHQFSIGGRSNLRGINSTSVSGDYGLSLTSEYKTSLARLLGRTLPEGSHIARLQPFAFLDAGMTHNRSSGVTSRGIGIGVGAKYPFRQNSVDFYIGVPVLDTGALRSNGPEIGLNLSVKVF